MSVGTVARPRGWRGLHYRLYDWVIRWAAHRHARTALFLFALVEASVFPIPPDVLLIAMCLSVPASKLRFAAIATVGSVLGGLLGYAIGWGFWAVAAPWFFDWLGPIGFTPENFERVKQLYQDNAFLALFAAGFSPIPYKVFTIAAGVFEIGLGVFVTASVAGRAARFTLVALIVGWLGAAARDFIEKYLGWLTLAFVVLLVLGFWVLKHLG